MNIIIGSDKSVRMTQYSNQSTYNIENIKFYISKDLSYSELILKLTQERSVYPFLLRQIDSVKNYNIFSIWFTQSTFLKERPYDLIITFDETDIQIGNIKLFAIEYNDASIMTFNMRRSSITNNYGLTDSDEPVDIVGREIKINNNQNQIVAEDNISQLITFRMPRFYEGIDLMEKEIYVDYIPLNNKNVVSDRISSDYITETSIEGDETAYILIPWVIKYEITKKAGIIPFAISIIDNLETLTNGRQYVWQTFPSSLVIQNNLGERASIPLSPGEVSPSEEILQRIAKIETLTENDIDVDSSSGMMTIYTETGEENISIAELLANNSEQEEILFNGGGAPI